MHGRRRRVGIAALVAIVAASILWAVVRNDGAADPPSRRRATRQAADAATTTEVEKEASGPESETTTSPDAASRSVPDDERTNIGAPKTSPPSTTSVPTRDPSGKVWVRVGHLSGSGNARSRAFELRGIDTRLVYLSKAGSLAVFIVDEVQGRDATGGFADLECDQPCNGEMLLVTPAGRYHLEVDAPPGMYDIAIEEYRRPN